VNKMTDHLQLGTFSSAGCQWRRSWAPGGKCYRLRVVRLRDVSDSMFTVGLKEEEGSVMWPVGTATVPSPEPDVFIPLLHISRSRLRLPNLIVPSPRSQFCYMPGASRRSRFHSLIVVEYY
jgi:hypothetical protein